MSRTDADFCTRQFDSLARAVKDLIAEVPGVCVVHGSCAAMDDACCLIIGESGAGKTSLALEFARDAGHLVADENTFLRLTPQLAALESTGVIQVKIATAARFPVLRALMSRARTCDTFPMVSQDYLDAIAGGGVPSGDISLIVDPVDAGFAGSTRGQWRDVDLGIILLPGVRRPRLERVGEGDATSLLETTASSSGSEYLRAVLDMSDQTDRSIASQLAGAVPWVAVWLNPANPSDAGAVAKMIRDGTWTGDGST